MARMGFLDKAEELDVMIDAERTRLKKVQSTRLIRSWCYEYLARDGPEALCRRSRYMFKGGRYDPTTGILSLSRKSVPRRETRPKFQNAGIYGTNVIALEFSGPQLTPRYPQNEHEH